MRSSLLLLIFLAGCATHAELVRDGERLDSMSSRSPTEIARCMNMRLLEGNPYRGKQWPLNDHGGVEVVVTIGESGGVVGIAQLEPVPSGTKITTWITKSSVNSAVRAYFDGC